MIAAPHGLNSASSQYLLSDWYTSDTLDLITPAYRNSCRDTCGLQALIVEEQEARRKKQRARASMGPTAMPLYMTPPPLAMRSHDMSGPRMPDKRSRNPSSIGVETSYYSRYYKIVQQIVGMDIGYQTIIEFYIILIIKSIRCRHGYVEKTRPV